MSYTYANITFYNTDDEAMVLSGIDEVLLGVIPIEDRDVIIDPFNEKSALPPDGHYLTRMKVKIVTSIV